MLGLVPGLSPVPGSDAQPLLTSRPWGCCGIGVNPPSGVVPLSQIPSQAGDRAGGWLILGAEASLGCAGALGTEFLHEGCWVGGGEKPLVTEGLCQGQVVLELLWVGRGGCETLPCPCCHLGPQSVGFGSPCGQQEQLREQRRIPWDPIPAVKGIQGEGVTWPSTWGLSHPELNPRHRKGGEKRQEKGSQGLFLELCCAPTSRAHGHPTNPCQGKSTPITQQLHFLPLCCTRGVCWRLPVRFGVEVGAARACLSRTALTRRELGAGRMGEHGPRDGNSRAMNGGDAPFINAGSCCSRAGVGNPQPAGAAPPSASKFPLIRCSCSFWLRWQSCGNAELELLPPGRAGRDALGTRG